jgi:dienelactone hydrolase
MDIWADLDGDLMRAAVASQSLAYVRQGFELNKAPVAVTIPPPGVLERDVTFPSDGLTVPGTLTLPEHSSHVPIAVLVQGSGVQDRDETVGQNKVFQQLAWGLAQRGIATLRYDRRPKFAPANFAQHADLDHEVVIDAASALAYCSSLPEINPKNVFLIGHSLGAQLAPYVVKRRLAQQPNSVRGYVLLAGVQTPIDQTLLRQIAEFGKAGGESDAEIQQQLAKWKAIFADIADPRTPADKLEGMGTTAGYWRDWLARDPAAVMKTLPVPALVLRGELDRNVLHEDFTALAAAATAQGSKSEEFPRLNHLFMPTADELLPGTIAPSVMDTISVWIKSLN